MKSLLNYFINSVKNTVSNVVLVIKGFVKHAPMMSYVIIIYFVIMKTNPHILSDRWELFSIPIQGFFLVVFIGIIAFYIDFKMRKKAAHFIVLVLMILAHISGEVFVTNTFLIIIILQTIVAVEKIVSIIEGEIGTTRPESQEVDE